MNVLCIRNADAADPSVLVWGNCCYMVNSSLAYLPGLLLWKSYDLLNWQPVVYAVSDMVKEVWAPDLVRFGDRFYIYFTADGRNWVVWASNIEGPYSQPVDLGVEDHIDPGHIADVETSEHYLFFSDGYMAKLSHDGLSILTKPEKVFGAWPFPEDWETEGICLEGPKLFYKNGYYYLTVAQGGTAGPATGHMAVSMRSKSLRKGWEYSPYNPILHTVSPEERWWSVGHATVFDWVDGNSYIIYHGYEKERYNEGRKALLNAIQWTNDGWFYAEDAPVFWKSAAEMGFEDYFKDESLDLRWSFSSSPGKSPYWITTDGLRLPACGDSLDTSRRMAINKGGDFVFRVEVTDIDTTCGVGIAAYYNQQCYVGLFVEGRAVYQIQREHLIPIAQLDYDVELLTLQMRKQKQVVSMWYGVNENKLQKCPVSFQVDGYNHNNFGGFTSLRPSIYLQGEGAATIRYVCFYPINNSV